MHREGSDGTGSATYDVTPLLLLLVLVAQACHEAAYAMGRGEQRLAALSCFERLFQR